MQKIDNLLAQTGSNLKKNSSASPIAAGRNSGAYQVAETRDAGYDHGDQADSPGQDVPAIDLVDAINQLFAEFELAYHNQYRKAYPDEASLILAKKYWLGCLSQYSPLQIVRAGRQAVRTQEYLPSVASVVKICETGLELFGLPPARSAYVEACRAGSPKAAWKWSHEAVYHAGKASGWQVLAAEPETVAFPLFEYHYQRLCQQVMQGKPLQMDIAPPLPRHAGKKLSRQEQQLRVRQLRKETGV